METKFALKLNLETIRKECTFCTPKNTALEANLGFIFKPLEKRFDRNDITLTKQNAKYISFNTCVFAVKMDIGM